MRKTVVGVALAILGWASPVVAEETFDLLKKQQITPDLSHNLVFYFI